MKNVASYFSEKARAALKCELNIELSDTKEYSYNELEDLYNQITDDFPYSYEADGSPTEMGQVFEEIINVFTASPKLIQFLTGMVRFILMIEYKVRYIGEDAAEIRKGEIYTAHDLNRCTTMSGVLDRSGEQYAYPKSLFEKMED